MHLKIAFMTMAVISSFVIANRASRADEFQLQCASTPFTAPNAAHPDIDGTCGIFGAEADDPNSAKAIQNSLKSNLCRTGTTTNLKQDDFVTMQTEAKAQHISFGFSGFGANRIEHLPQDRTPLTTIFATEDNQTIGEGNLVQLVALMDWPHYADASSGESVNCKIPGTDTNDIHINLVQTPAPPRSKSSDPDHAAKTAERNAALCGSITAEIIPHYRPAAWEVPNLQEVERQHLPVRISGQLFFDASHYPCTGTTSHDSLKRASLWEIHPVYSIDVCKQDTIQSCAADDASVWVPLDKWIENNLGNSPIDVEGALDTDPE